MKSTLVCTVLNEENSIHSLLVSVSHQTLLPDEMIIVDGGSSDKTIIKIERFQKLNKQIPIILVKKVGNRAISRNYGISLAKNSIILLTDAGCILDKHWVERITLPFRLKKNHVVAGYYKGGFKTKFEKCLIPYVLVMPDKINPTTFLPATRSMAILKSTWKRVGGFPEKFSHNEDYVFAKKLKQSRVRIVFVKDAQVTWIPPKNIKKVVSMFYRFSFGDAEAGIYRTKVIGIFVRYMVLLFVCIGYLSTRNQTLFYFLLGGCLLYLVWAIAKNIRYVNVLEGLLYLPFLQMLSDIAILSGTTLGSMRRRKW